jgi:excisionase family DNA binding protein
MSEVTVYTADEAAAILRCTASWLREKARRREIPFTMPGGSYGWTPGHLAEIIRLFEFRPGMRADAPVPARRSAAKGDEVAVLKARAPRRSRGAA